MNAADALRSVSPLFKGRQHPPLFCSFPQRDGLLAELQSVVENTEHIPLITGPDGAGKTTLVYQFLHQAQDNWVTCRVDANPMLHPDQFLVRLAHELFIKDPEDDLDNLVLQRAYDLRLTGRLPVVVIDDADQLPQATLIRLLSLHERKRDDLVLIRFVLFATDRIEAQLRAPQVRLMNLQVLRPMAIPPLDGEQTAYFTRFFLAAHRPGARLPRPSVRDLDGIYRDSQGWPGAIERRVLEWVQAAVAPPRRWSVSKGRLRLLVVGAVAVLVCALAVWLWPKAPESEEVPLPAPEPELKPMNGQGGGQVGLPNQIWEQPPPFREPERAPEKVEIPPSPLVVPVVPAPEGVVLLPTGPQGPLVAAPSDGDPSINGKAPAWQGVSPGATLPVEPPPAPVVPVSEPLLVAELTPSIGSIRGEEWIMRQRPGAYTIQLLASGDAAAVRGFLERHPELPERAWYHTRRGPPVAYAGLFGVFAGRAEAEAALARLPAELRRNGAWSRSFGAVQGQMRSGR